MDASLFWGLLILPGIIYACVLYQVGNIAIRTVQFLFYAVAVFFFFALIALTVREYDYNSLDGGIYLGWFGLAISSAAGHFGLKYLIKEQREKIEKSAEDARRLDEMSPAERAKELKKRETAKKQWDASMKASLYGEIVPALVCQHCQTKGVVRRKSGLSEQTHLDKWNRYKQKGVQKFYCDNCNTRWEV